MEFESAVGIAQIGCGGDVSSDGRPHQPVILVVEKSHALGDMNLALDQRTAVRHFDGVVGVVGHVSLRAFFSRGFHELGFQLLQRLGRSLCGWFGGKLVGQNEHSREGQTDYKGEKQWVRFHAASVSSLFYASWAKGEETITLRNTG